MDTVEITLLILCLLNSFMSFYLYTRQDFDKVQKLSQIVIVWILPLLGAVSLWIFHSSQNKPIVSMERGIGGGPVEGSGGFEGGD